MRRNFPIRYCIAALCLLVVCISYSQQAARPGGDNLFVQTPAGFPVMEVPLDNQYSAARWQLGKRLFYDKRLSRNNTISCSSCHRQEFAFSDSVAFSPGDNAAQGTSNAPTLTNIGYHPYFTRGGSVPTLEMQVLVPVQEHNEFNTSILDIAEKLKPDSSYRAMAAAAYGREIDPFVITRALACFERSLVSGNSRFDRYYYGGAADKLDEEEIRGMKLFYSPRTSCSGCHSGFNFTNYSFENNGLYLKYADSGRMRFTRKESDRAKFKVPTLRNIALTAPYMHDGSMKTLEQVVDHYNSGGAGHRSKSALIRPLHLTRKEKKELVAFLKTLTDHSLITDKNLKNE